MGNRRQVIDERVRLLRRVGASALLACMLLGCGAAQGSRPGSPAAVTTIGAPPTSTSTSAAAAAASTGPATPPADRPVVPPAAVVEAGEAPASLPPAPALTDAPPTAPASVPGRPGIHVERDPTTGTCHVTWTPPVDDGGSPLLGYVVATESAPVPPTNGVDIGTAAQVVRTTDTEADIAAGSSVTVSAENSVGTGPGVGHLCS